MRDDKQNTETSQRRTPLAKAIDRLPLAMVLSDPNLPDNPLVYVNQAFEQVTLYARAAAVGRNCRFLQGEDTDPEDVRRLAAAISEEKEITVDLLNYKADGTAFINRLLVAPVYGEDGRVEVFLGVQMEVTGDEEVYGEEAETMLRELQHRVKNHLAMVVSMIRMQAKREITPDSFEALSHRVESLALLYEELNPSGVAHLNAQRIPAGAYLSRVANTLGALDGRASVRVNVECEEIDLPVEAAARMGLMLTEFMTNALEHAFRDRDEGVVRVRFQRLTGSGVRLMVEDDGVGLPDGSKWPRGAPSVEHQRARTKNESGALDTRVKHRSSGMGGSIVNAMLSSLGGKLSVTSATRGTVVTLDVENVA